ncbi:NADPH-dependent F420 reductase [Promicromonospora sukumoe]
MRIAILGTGPVGIALGNAFIAAGHDVVYGSRSPEKDGLPAPVTTTATAADSADLILTALPGAAAISTLEAVGDDVLAGKIVLDVSNAVTPEGALAYPNDSVGRLMQERFPDAKVVKSLSTMYHGVMTDPTALGATTVYVSGNDEGAKAVVKSLLTDLGWPEAGQLDLGGIETAVGPEHYIPLFFMTLQVVDTPVFNINVVR